ncbi:MAG: PqqD family protein [Planctomycetota bacterium]
MSTRYQVSGPHIVHETIDDEVVIVNMETGAYYSLQGSGQAIWSLAEAGKDASEIDASFAAAPGVEPIEKFLQELVSEQLITVSERAAAAEVDVAPGEFVAPALEKFTDMEDFLLVDPIHEVGEQGWPNKP